MANSDLQLSSSSSLDQPNQIRQMTVFKVPELQPLVLAFSLSTPIEYESDTPYSTFEGNLFEFQFVSEFSRQFELLYEASLKSELLTNPPDELLLYVEELTKFRQAVNALFSSGENFIIRSSSYLLFCKNFDMFVYTFDEKIISMCVDEQGALKMPRAKALDLVLYESCQDVVPELYSDELFQHCSYSRPLVKCSINELGVSQIECQEPILGDTLHEFLCGLEQFNFETEQQFPFNMREILSIEKKDDEIVVKLRD